MNLQFRSLSDHTEVKDMVNYIKNIVDSTPNTILYVGTDSQNARRNTVYATVIVLHYGNHGAHVLYSRETMPKIRDRFVRLWGEVERSVEVSNILKDNNLTVKNIDLDYNEDPKFNSNTVLRSAIGYVEASGFKARWKPHNAYSVRVADQLCK